MRAHEEELHCRPTIGCREYGVFIMKPPLEAILDPLHESPPAQTLPPIDYGKEPNPALKTAVLVCHGMGQQVRFQTLNDIVQLLREEAERTGGVPKRRSGSRPRPSRSSMAESCARRCQSVNTPETLPPLTRGLVGIRAILAVRSDPAPPRALSALSFIQLSGAPHGS